MRRRRGVTTTEYMMLLSVLIVSIVAAAYIFVPGFQAGVGSLGQTVRQILSHDASDSSAGGGSSESSCPYVFDSRTGRWHDTDGSYLMVSFPDAAAAGC